MDEARTHNRAWRSLAAVLLAACLALGLTALQPLQAQAVVNSNETFTVKCASTGTSYNVAAYMLFSAHVDDDGNAATEVNWNGVYKEALQSFLISQPDYAALVATGELAADDAASALSYIASKIQGDSGLPVLNNSHKATGDLSFATQLAKEIATLTPTKPAQQVKAGFNASFTGLTEGYYLFYGESLPPIWTPVGGTESEAVVKDMLQLAAAKRVFNEEEGTWERIAAGGGGRTMRFQVEGQAPNSIPPVGTAFSYSLVDTLSKGLVFDANPNVRVYAYDGEDRTELEGYFTVNLDSTKKKLTASCSDLFATGRAQSELMRSGKVTHIVFEYEAVLTGDAGAGTSYNDNSAVIQYKRGDSAVLNTEPAVARVATFNLEVKKSVSSGSVLKQSAKFTLSTRAGGTTMYFNEEGVLSENRFELKTEDGYIYLYGIPAGTYALTEIEPPEGYKMPDVATTNITITPVFDQDGGALSDISVIQDNSESVTVEKDVGLGTITVTVPNEPKTTLPITGMEPSQLGTIIGALLVAAGIAALLVRARRKARA